MQAIIKLLVSVVLVLTLVACSSTGRQPSGVSSAASVAAAKAKTDKRYAIKQDVGPKQHRDMSNAPDALPKVEARSRGGNKSRYEVWGKQYSVMASSVGFKQRGLASWYGQKFHGHLTSNGETYDMYAMSAAHKSLPLPSYARITNLANNKVVIVRVNDRGPFHGDRVIDLSYAAASKLDYRKTGVAEVLIEAIDPRTWTPAMEQSIRQQRNLSSYTAVKVVQVAKVVKVVKAKPKAKSVAEPVNEIRQQRNRAQDYYVQIAAVSQISGAMLLRSTLTQALKRSDVFVEQASDRAGLFRVLIGPIVNGPSASVLMQEIVRLGHGQGVMIRP